MPTQHKNIVEADLHEIKGASTATANTVPVANGLGASPFGKLPIQGLDGIASAGTAGQLVESDGAGATQLKHASTTVHGEMFIANGSTSVGPTGGTITSDAHYVAVGTPWVLGDDASNVQLYTGDAALQTLVGGHFLLSSFVSFDTGAVASGTEYAIKYRVNGSATLSTRRLRTQKVTAGADGLTISGTALLSLAANDRVEIMLASSTADTVTVTDAGLTLVLLHEV